MAVGRLFVCAIACALLGACSAVKLGYNQADHIALWMADDYFDLSGEQKDAFRGHFERLHAWHRSSQLAQYVGLLEVAQKRIQSGVRLADTTWAIDSVKAQYRTVVLRGYADAARVLATLSDQQLAAARKQFDKTNRKYARDFGVGASPDEQRRLRAKRNLERIEHWTGPLSAAQEAKIAELSRALPLVTDLRDHDRKRRQHEFLALLAERKDAEGFPNKLRDWLLDWDRTRASGYEAALTEFVDASSKMYVEAFMLLNREQRSHVVARLQRYIVVFRELAGESARGAAEEKRG